LRQTAAQCARCLAEAERLAIQAGRQEIGLVVSSMNRCSEPADDLDHHTRFTGPGLVPMRW
jgi:hypothetical protein